jgi:hypothetical protein
VPTRDDVRRIALSMPGTTEDKNGFRFFVDGKQFAWAWMERLEPKRARVPNQEVIAVRVAGEIDVELLREILTRAWRSRAPKRLLAKGEVR